MRFSTIFGRVLALSTAVVAADETLSSKGSTKSYPVTVNGINLKDASVELLAAALANGTITSLELVDAYVCTSLLTSEPFYTGLGLNSILEIAPTARDIARKLDSERANGTVRSAIHGLPILVKDAYNTDMELGMNTTAGSYAFLQGSHAKGDAFVVKRLRDAGAIIPGKANLDERGGPNNSAWSARGGRISSAYVEGGFSAGGDPGGSSGGPAVAVSAASRAALYGLPPSTGITSRTGVVPIYSSQDTTGPFGKSVWDIAALLEIMAAHDPEDHYSEAADPFRHQNYTQFLDADGFKGLRIGIPREPFLNASVYGYGAGINPAAEAILVKLQSIGAEIIDPIVLPNAQRWKYEFVGGPIRNTAGRIQIQYDVKTDIANYLITQRTNTTGIETLYDIINFNDANAELEFPPGICCQEAFIAIDQVSPKNSSGEYWWAKWQQQQLNQEGIE